MNIIVDEKNKAVIAIGEEFGHKVKGLAIARKGDAFDPEFGTKLATIKYKRNTQFARLTELYRQREEWCDTIDYAEDQINKINDIIEKIENRSDYLEEQVSQTILSKYPEAEVV